MAEACYTKLRDNKLSSLILGSSKVTQALGYELLGGMPCDMSVSEALAAVFVCLYDQAINPNRQADYHVGIAIEASYFRDQEKRKKYLGDGVIVIQEGDRQVLISLQVTQAIKMDSNRHELEDEVIRVVQKKLKLRLKYADVCALVVPIVSYESSVAYAEILAACTPINFEWVYFLEYSNAGQTCTVLEFNGLGQLQHTPLTITPQLVQ